MQRKLAAGGRTAGARRWTLYIRDDEANLPMNNPSISRNSSTWRWLAIGGWLGLLVAVFFQWHSITRLRHEVEALRAQPQAAAPNAPSQPAASAAGETAALEQLQKERLEVLELVKELRRLAPAHRDGRAGENRANPRYRKVRMRGATCCGCWSGIEDFFTWPVTFSV